MATAVGPLPSTSRRPFYSLVVLLALLLIFAGFARTYYLKTLFDTPVLPLLVHLHGAVMTGWFALLFIQARLIATHRTAVHRRLGIFGAVWALVVLMVGFATAIHAARRGFTPPAGPPPLVFLVVPLMDLLVFAALTGAALWFRRRPDIHRRLMLMGSVGILAPAVGRLPIIDRSGLPVIFGLVLFGAAACVAYDTWRNRSLHPAFGWSLLFVVISVPLRVGLAGTAGWQRFAAWLIS